MPCYKPGGKIHYGLVPGVIDPEKPCGKVSIAGVVPRILNLLIRSPNNIAIVLRRVVEQQNQRNDQPCDQQPLSASGLQNSKAEKNRTQPECGGQHNPANSQKREDPYNTPQKHPLIR